MKKLKMIIISIITLSIMSLSNYMYGATSLSSSATSVKTGDTFTVNVNVSNVATWELTLNYSSNVSLISGGTKFVRADNGIENVTVTAGTVTFKALTDGVANISVGGNSYTSTGDPSGSSASKSVTISTPVVVASTPAPVTPAATATTTPAKTTTTPAKSSNANLSSLKVSQEGLSPTFNKSKTSYSLSVGQSVTSIKVTAIAEDSGSKVSVSGNSNLADGDNIVTILVTAADGTKKTYKITVNKSSDPAKANAYLQSLIVENATLSPDYEKEILEYDCGTVASNIEKLSLLAFPENQQAKVEITGNDALVDGENTIKIKVTAVDGSTTKEYTIKVTKEAKAAVQAVAVYDETNSLTTTPSGFGKFLYAVWMYLKTYWLVLSLFAFCIFEFIQIVIMYRRLYVSKNIDNADIIEDEDTLNSEAETNFGSRRRSLELEKSSNDFSWRVDSKKEKLTDKTENKVQDNKDIEENNK